MGNKIFLHFLKCLSAVVLALLLPSHGYAANANQKDLVGGTLEGWQLYWGSYSAKENKYDWTRVGKQTNTGSGVLGETSTDKDYKPSHDSWKDSKNSWPDDKRKCAARFYVSGIGSTGYFDPDPLYSTGKGLTESCIIRTVPEGYFNSMRVGSVSHTNDKNGAYAAECMHNGQSNNEWTSAEAVTYDLKVTELNAMLTINYMFVGLSPNCKGDHSKDTYGTACGPGFDLKVYRPIETGQEWYNEVKCGTEALNACDVDGCKITSWEREPVHSPWTSAVYDLSPYIGKTVRIYVAAHDCIYKGQSCGGHFGYVYFTARTEPLQLTMKYCSSKEPVTAEAPEGMNEYRWYGQSPTGALKDIDGFKVKNEPNKISVLEASKLSEYDTLVCIMNKQGLGCELTVKSFFKPSDVEAKIKPELGCDRLVSLTDVSTTADKVHDSIVTRTWYVLNEDYNNNTISELEALFANGTMKPTQHYTVLNETKTTNYTFPDDVKGRWVRLWVQNTQGCEAYSFMFIKPNPVLKWATEEKHICEDAPVELKFVADTEYAAREQRTAPQDNQFWSVYTGLPNNLKYEVLSMDGVTTTPLQTGKPGQVDTAASLQHQRYKFTVTDQFGCSKTDYYNITVEPKPELYLNSKNEENPLVTGTDLQKGVKIYYVCPRAKINIGAYSPNANKFLFSTQKQEEAQLVTNKVDANYICNEQTYGIGTYFVQVTQTADPSCTARLYFNISYNSDTVSIIKPENICPNEEAIIQVVNNNTPCTWWETAEDDPGATQTNVKTADAYVIERPSASKYYHYQTMDRYGCDYKQTFTLDVQSTHNNTFDFQKDADGNQIVPTVSKSGHTYTLPNLCSTDLFSITATINSQVTSAKHSYKTNYDASFVDIPVTGSNQYTVSKNGFAPRQGQDLMIVWKTIPFNAAGEQLCIIYDTILVKGFPEIMAKVNMTDENGNRPQTYNFNYCDEDKVILNVNAWFKGQTENDLDNNNQFDIRWTDALGEHSADQAFTTQSVINLGKASENDANGQYYTYIYTITSKDGGCTNSFEVPVYVNPNPQFSLAAKPEYLCEGSSQEITATDLNAGKTYGTYENPTVFKWTFPDPADVATTKDYYAANNTILYKGIQNDQIFTIVGTTQRGCTASEQIKINTAVTPKLSVKLVAVDGRTELENVCAGSEYMLQIEDENDNKYLSQLSCDEKRMIKVTRKSKPFNNVPWQEEINGTDAEISNHFLQHVYKERPVNFGLYTAANGETTELYDITITSPCGCEASIVDYAVKVIAAPKVTLDRVDENGNIINKDFLCPDDKLYLQAKTNSPVSNGYPQFGWTVAQEEVAANDVANLSSPLDALAANKEFDWNADMQSFVYTAHVFDGKCYGSDFIKVYNQKTIDFNVEAEPSTMCESNSQPVVLKAYSTDLGGENAKYYLKTRGTYAQALPWENGVKEVNNIASVLDADKRIWVRAGVAMLVNSNTIRTDNSNYFCYNEKKVEMSVQATPQIGIKIKNNEKGVFVNNLDHDQVTNQKLCPGEVYTIEVKNLAKVDGVRDVITITNVDDNTISYTQTVAAGVTAIFNDIAASTEELKDRWTISITPFNTACGVKTEAKVEIAEMPRVRIDQNGGKKIAGTDTVVYCVNYYALLQNNSSTNKSDVRWDGVNLTAVVENMPSADALYTYLWKKDGSTSGLPAVEASQQTVKASVNATTTSSGYNHSARYSVVVSDANGCSTTMPGVVVTAHDAPRFGFQTDNPSGGKTGTAWTGNGCVNSQVEMNVYEGRKNIRISKWNPIYTYDAYFVGSDGTNQDDIYRQLGREVPISSLSKDGVDGFGNWTTFRNSGQGTLKDPKTGIIVSDSCSQHDLRKRVWFQLGEESKYIYAVTKTDSMGCTAYQTIHYTPHEFVDPDNFMFDINVYLGGDNTKLVNKTDGQLIKLSDISSNEDDTLAFVCPGDFLVFNFVDQTGIKRTDNNPWQWNQNYYVTVEYLNNGTNGGGWYNFSSASDKQVLATTKTLTSPQKVRFKIQRNSNQNGCVTYSNWFWITQGASPKLTSYGDDACRLNIKGEPDGLVKFRAASNAPEGSVHHYTWWTADNTKEISKDDEGYTISGDNNEYLTLKTNYASQEFGTAENKAVSVYLRDEVEGYCRSADIKITRYVWQNPEFTIEPDKGVVCKGETINFKVTQDYNIARANRWHRYSTVRNESTTGYKYSMLNDGQYRKTDGYASADNLWPHYFIHPYQVTESDEDFVVSAFYNTDRVLGFDQTAGSNIKLHCYTHKPFTVHGLENPDPVVKLNTTDESGKYKKDETFLTVSVSQRDQTGSYLVCPGTNYYRVFSNNNPDVVTNFTQSNTSYFIKDKTSGEEFSSFSAPSTQTYTQKATPSFVASDHKYVFYAKTSNGCVSDSVEFTPPVSKTPVVEINKQAAGVCAGDVDNSMTLTANAINNGPFTYEWYVNSIHSNNSLTNRSDASYVQWEVNPNSANSKFHADSVDYHVVVTNADGCEGDTFTRVYIYPLPQFEAKLLTEKPCANESVQIQLSKAPSENNYIAGNKLFGDKEFGYKWDDAKQNPIGTSAGPVNTAPIKAQDQELSIIASVENNRVVCSDKKQIIIPSHGLPSPTVQIIVAEDNGKYKAGDVISSGSKVCPGTKYKLRFTNNASSSDCNPDHIYLTDQATNVEEVFKTPAGKSFTTDVRTITKSENFTYKIVSGCGCESASDAFSLEVATVPDILISGPTEYCANAQEQITLTATATNVSSGMKWKWTPSPTADNTSMEQTFVPQQQQTYIVTGMTEFGCASTAEHTITPLQIPILQVTYPDKAVCENDEVELSVKNVNDQVEVRTFEWTSTDGRSWNAESINVKIAHTTDFTVVATAENGLSCKSITENFTVQAAKVPEIKVQCYYEKENNAYPFDPEKTKVCPGSLVYPIFENVKSDPTLCETNTYEFWEDGQQDHYKVEVTTGVGIQANNGANKYKFKFGDKVTNYFYKVTSSCGCGTDVKRVTVGAAQIPYVVITGENTYCDNVKPSFVLTANSASAADLVTYKWSENISISDPTNENGKYAVVEPHGKESKYTVSVVNTSGCESEVASHTIKSIEAPTLSWDAPNYVCIGDEADVKINVQSDSPVSNTVWTPVQSTKIDNNAVEVTMAINEPTTFRVQVTTENGCVVTSSDHVVNNYKEPEVELVIMNAVTGAIIKDQDAICEGVSFIPTFKNKVIGDKNSYCERDTIILTCVTTGEQLKIDGQNGTILNNDGNAKSFTMGKQDMLFRYQLRTSCGCYSPQEAFTIKLATAPYIRIDAAKRTFCEGSNEELTIKATTGDDVTDASMTWNWTSCPTEQKESATHTFRPSRDIETYIVEGRVNDGCVGNQSITIQRIPSPQVTIGSDKQTYCLGDQVTLTAVNHNENNAPLDNVYWTTEDGSIDLNGITTKFNASETVEIKATAVAKNGCRYDVDPITITTAAIPEPTVTLWRNSADATDGRVQIDTKKARLCPGQTYYAEFQNTTADNTCTNDKFHVTSVDGAYDETFIIPSGGIANNHGSVKMFEMGNTAQAFNYSVETTCGCQSSVKSFMVNVAQEPIISISGEEWYCNNTEKDITLSVVTSNKISTYKWNDQVEESQRGNQTVTVRPNGTQTYSVTAISEDGCKSNIAEHTITARMAPIVQLRAPEHVCAGSRVEVEANIEYTTTDVETTKTEWTTNTSYQRLTQFDKISAAISDPTTFKATVTASNGCRAESDEITVNPIEHPVPQVEFRYIDGNNQTQTFDPETQSLCKGTVYYPVFKNEVKTNTSCQQETYTLSQGGQTIGEFFTTQGNPANESGDQHFTVDGTKTFLYTMTNGCGCASDVTGQYTIRVATSPIISIMSTGLKGKNLDQYCEGETNKVTLTATSNIPGTTFIWEAPVPTGENTNAEISVVPSTTSYTVVGETPDHCTGEFTFTMTELPKPSVSIEGDQSVCAGQKATLTAVSSDAVSYLWNNGKSSTSISETINQTTPFSVIGYSKDGCLSEPFPFEVEAKDKPIITFEYSGYQNSGNVCDGELVTITASAQNSNATFSWFSDGSRQNPLVEGDYVQNINGASITVKPITNSTTSYYVTADIEGCTAPGNAQVKAFALPKFAVTGRTSYCEGQDLELKIQNPDQYLKEDPSDPTLTYQATNFYWDGNTVDASNSFSNRNITTLTSSVNVIAIDEHNCQTSKNIPITVNQSPRITVGADHVTVCPNESAELSASGADSYLWTVKGKNDDVKGKRPEYTTGPVTAEITYRVLGTITSSQCSDSNFVTVSVKRLPTMVLLNDVNTDGEVLVCSGDKVNLQVKGADEYTWLTQVEEDHGSTATIKPSINRVYRVEGSIDGCTRQLEIPVVVLDKPKVELDAEEGVCSGSYVHLVAKVNESASQVTGMTYSWSDDNHETSNKHEVAITTPQTFRVTVQSASGCEAYDEKTVDAYSLPQAQIEASLSTVCLDSTVKLTPVVEYGTPQYKYKWTRTHDNYTYTSEELNPIIRPYTDANGEVVNNNEFTLVVTDAHKCESTPVKREIFVQPKKEIKNVAPTTFCQGAQRDSVRLNLSGATEYTYNGSKWTAKFDSVIYRNSAGAFSVVIDGRVPLEGAKDKYCPTTSITENMVIAVAPKLEMFLTNTITDGVCAGSPVALKVKSSILGNVTYDWEGVIGNNQDTYVHDALYKARTFKCIVKDNTSGCSATAEKPVYVYEVPQVSFDRVPSPVCENAFETLSAKATSESTDQFTWAWTRGTDDTWQPTTQSVNVKITENEKFTVIATDALHNCSSKEISTYIDVQKLPELGMNYKAKTCESDSVHFNFTGYSEYFFDNQLMAKPDTALKLPVGTAFFSVYGRVPRANWHGVDGYEQYCVSDVKQISADVVAAPNVQLVGNQNICEGDQLDLKAEVLNYNAADAARLTYTWSLNASNKTNVLQQTITAPTIVTVSVTDGGCTGVAEEKYNVWPKPVVNINIPDGSDIACMGDMKNLSAYVTPQSDQYSYLWVSTDGDTYTTSSIQPVIKDETTFTLQVSDNHGCTSKTAQQTVKAYELPKVHVQGSNTLCKDGVLTLTLSGATKFWVNNEELVDNDGNPLFVYTEKMTTAHTGYYIIQGATMIPATDQWCYSDALDRDATFTVEVKDKPTLTVAGNRTICEGDKLTLNVSGADSYTWGVQDLNPSDDVFEVIPAGNVDGIYHYEVTGTLDASKGGCSAKENVTVVANKAPNLTIESSAKGVCVDEVVTLTAKPGPGSTNLDRWTYVWTGGQLTGTQGQTVHPVVTRGDGANVAASNKFSVKATNDAGCSKEEPIEISIYELPEIVIYASDERDNYNKETMVESGRPLNLCENTQLRLEARPAANSASVTVWKWDANAETAVPSYYPESTSKLVETYTVVGKTSFGCKASASVEVAMTKAPEIQLKANPMQCLGTDIVLEPSGAADYFEWPAFNYEQTQASEVKRVTADQVGKRTYVVYGYRRNEECRGKADVTVEVRPLPTFTVNNIGAYQCQGETATLIAVPDNKDADYTYSWSPGGGTQNTINISRGPRFYGTDDYTVVVTDKESGCIKDYTVPVTWYEKPNLSLINGISSTVCSGNELNLVAEGANEYYWEVDGELNGPYYKDEVFTSTPKVPGTNKYTLHGVNYNYNLVTGDEIPCDASKDFDFKVVNSPSIYINGSDLICYGDQVSLTANGIDMDEVGDYDPKYVWNDAVEGATFKDKFTSENGSSVVYTVKGTSANGCTSVKTKTVTMRPKTVINIDADRKVCEGALATATVRSDANIKSYRWNTEEVSATIGHAITQDETKYVVTATDENDCRVKDSVTIKMQPKLVLIDATVGDKVNDAYEVCAGQNISLKVEGASEYMWNNNPTLKNSSITLAPLTDTIYTVEGKFDVCTASMQIMVRALAAPVISIVGDRSACMGDDITLKPYSDEKDLDFVWSTSYNNKRDGDNIIISPTRSDKITLTANTKNGRCQSQVSDSIFVNNLPNLDIEGDLSPCENSNAQLLATGAINYEWRYEGNKINSVGYSPIVGTDPVDIVLWGIDAHNCTNEITRTLTPVARPTFTVEGNRTICKNTTLQLQARNDQTACIYVWDFTDTVNIYNKLMKKAGTQSIPVTAILANKPGCSYTDFVNVVVNDLPELYLTGNNYPCQNTTMEVLAHGAEKYKWGGQDEVEAPECSYTRVVTSNATFNASLSGWKNGCRKDTVFQFKVHSSPLVTINADMQETCAEGIVTLTANSPNASVFDWGKAGAGATITPVITKDSTFVVEVYDEFQCKGTDKIDIKIVSSPTINIEVSEENNGFVKLEGQEVLTYKACDAANLLFSGHGAKSWSWVDGLESSDESTYSIDEATNMHRIKVTGYLGNCEATKEIRVEILNRPDIWIDGLTNVCQGDSVHLVAKGADSTYVWSGISEKITGKMNDTLDAAVLYQSIPVVVTGIGKNGCKTNKELTLTYTEAPALNVSANEDVCVGTPSEMTIVNPDANVVYVWNENFAGESFEFRSTKPGEDSVKVEAKVRGLGGCNTVKKFAVMTHELPTITFDADGEYASMDAKGTVSMCAGSDVTLKPQGASTYEWNIDGKDTITTWLTVKPTSNVIYRVTGTDGYGCVNKQDIMVKTISAPILYSKMYGPATDGVINVGVCRESSITLDVMGADDYTWFDASKQKQVNVTPTDDHIYTVQGKMNANGCPAELEYHVKVIELPEVDITDANGTTGKGSYCKDDKIELTAQGAGSYVWYDMNGAVIGRKESITDYAGESDYYTVIGTSADQYRCKNEGKFIVKAYEVPEITFEPSNINVCAGERTVITGRGTDVKEWFWMNGKDTIQPNNNKLVITPDADVTYTLYGKNKQGCAANVDVPVSVFTAPSVWIDGYTTTNGVSETIKVCKYQDFTLTAMGDALSYEWPSGSTSNSITVENASMTQTYQVTGIGQNNCKTTIRVPVEVIPTALITIKGDQYVCYGESTKLNAIAQEGDYDNYVWSNNMIGTENEVFVQSDTTFTVTGFNSQTGCSNKVQFPIKVKELPNVGFQGETTICKGASSVIYGTGANTYVWHDGSEGDTYVSTPTTNAIYTVTGTINGCSKTISVPITVEIAPVIWADGLKPICKGEELSLTAMGADSYEWSDGSTNAIFKALPLADVTYTLTGTAANGCKTTIPVPVTVRELPVVTADGSTSVCLNSTTDLKAVITSSNTNVDGTGNQYRWYLNNEVISTQNVLNYLITEGKTKFVLEGIDPAGCKNTANISVSSIAIPVISYVGPEEICTGSTGTFYATGAKDYQWINGGDTVVGNVFKASPKSDTYYQLIGTSALGCTNKADILLVVNQVPEVSVSGNTSVCRGESLDLTGAGAKTYKWSNGSTDEHFISVPVASSDYTLTGTDANGCSSTVKFAVTVNELPEFNVRATSEGVCETEKDTLYAVNTDKAGEYTYFWTTEDGTNLSGDSISPIIAENTTFTVTANNNATHCQSSVKKTIYAYMKPVIGFLGKDSVCSGGSLTITAVGADSYSWENNGKVVSTDPTFTINNAKASTELYVTGKLATCSATKVYSIKVVPTPSPTIAEVNGHDYACRGSEIELIGSCFSDKKGIYKWTANGDTLQVDTAIHTELIDLPRRTTSYSLTAINSFGCKATTTKVISMQELPSVGISVDKRYVCPNQLDSVKFTAKNTGKNNVQWNWQSRPGQDDIYSNAVKKSFTAIIDTTVMVYLYGTDELGCVGVDSTLISLRPSTNMKFRLNPSCIDNDSRKVRFAGIVPENEGTIWTWNVDMTKSDTVMGAIANYEYKGVLPDSIEVGVHAVDPYGCMFDSTAYIYKWHDFWAPEAFSPNGDGLNDRFVFRGGRFIDEFHVVIYDRLGAIVYEGDETDLIHSASDDIPTDKGWDGTCNGKPCPWGVYGYTVTYKSSENSVSKSGKKKGMITLMR